MTQHPIPDNASIGVDIGGTKVAVGLVDSGGKILSQLRKPMIPTAEPDAALQVVIDAIDALAAQTAENAPVVRAIGICAPGPLDPITGVVVNPPNLPCWRNYPLVSKITERYHVPVKLDNDANAAALAETRWGAAHGYRYVFYATIGTGIEAGLCSTAGSISDARVRPVKAATSASTTTVRAALRQKGCIEILAAGPAIAGRARAKLSAQSARSAILDLANGKVENLTTEIVGKAYAQGDPVARQVLEETVELLTIWLGNIVDLLDPDVIVIGGGVAAMLRPFFEQMKKRLPNWCVNPRAYEIPLLLAHYGADAGIAGGAALISE